MTWQIHETSNPYLLAIQPNPETGEPEILMAIDQLEVDPETNEQRIVQEAYIQAA